MTTNQFQQNMFIKLADDYLSILFTRNVMKFPVVFTKKFNSANVGQAAVGSCFAVKTTLLANVTLTL